MNKKIKRLFLNKETLRNLSERDLRVVDGGATYYCTSRCPPTVSCGDTCATCDTCTCSRYPDC